MYASALTTKTGLIWDWRRTRPAVELQRRYRHAQARSSRCRGSADSITATRQPPESRVHLRSRVVAVRVVRVGVAGNLCLHGRGEHAESLPRLERIFDGLM